MPIETALPTHIADPSELRNTGRPASQLKKEKRVEWLALLCPLRPCAKIPPALQECADLTMGVGGQPPNVNGIVGFLGWQPNGK